MTSAMRVLLALLLGTALGLILAHYAPPAAATLSNVLQPLGRLWLNALQMTIVPLVVSLLIVGVNLTRDAAASGRVARRAVLCIVALLFFGAIFAAVFAPAFLALLPRDAALVETLRAATGTPVAAAAPASLADWFAGIVPTNAIAAAAQGAIVPLVVFTLLFAFALTRIENLRRQRLIECFQAIADTMTVIVGWVLWAAPLGVFALILPVSAKAGSGMLQVLGWYIALQCTLYASIALLMYAVAVLFGRESLGRFATAVAPAQAVAASTQSSLASLPAMLQSAQRLGYSAPVSALVLPLAVSLFRIASPVQYIGVSAFIAWAYGIDIPTLQWGFAVLLAVAISVGSAGLPGQATFMGTNLPVVQSLGLPIEPMGLLLAVELVPDIFATVGNVTADLAATSVVARGEDPAAEPSA
ncbi:Na+/H+-dicarboxylate symporter [Tahibacter aquaticus]|uniref:Na+/H+-dicarboxylate symporter n=1 Tax=Tahibacter aquaticus TaxID=520092 RepID=A0A4R6YMR4_9GAMM|nr:cation:dicarboxylase symporter family transporter [Tahibacter aquaticus]TDR38764.1 Na+/H+-dicarboxylate symporter [Tahibacter aquaticus]